MYEQPQMDPGEIIRQAAPRQAPGIPVEQVMASIAQELNTEGTYSKQFGNTFFIAHPTEKEGVFMFRALNADTPQNYIRNVLDFFAEMFQYGIRIMVTEFEDPSIINIAKAIQAQMDEGDDLQYAVQKTSTGGFRMTVYLGEGFMSQLEQFGGAV